MFRKGKLGWLLLNIFEALLLIVAGVLAMAYCQNKGFQNAIILTIGCLVIADAVLRIVLDVVSVVNIGDVTLIKTTYGQAVTGALEMACGVLLVVIGTDLESATIVFHFIGIFIGTLVAIAGLVAIVYAIVYLVKKAGETWKNIVLIVIGVLLIAGCITAAILLERNILVIFLVLFGIILALAGALVLYLTIAYYVEIKRAEKAEKATASMNKEVVEVETEEPTTEEKKEETPVEETKTEETSSEEKSDESDAKEEPADDNADKPEETASEDKPNEE